jgi:hypothetical protein
MTSTELATIKDLTITGTIDARDFKTLRDNMPLLAVVDLSNATIVAYTGTDGTATTNSYSYEANEIPRRAFSFSATNTGKETLTSIALPSSLKKIGFASFYSCQNLGSLIIPTSVTSIADYAFPKCSSLKTLAIPPSVTSLGYGAFANSGLINITFSEGLKTIGDYAFQSCNYLTTVSLPASLIRIGYCAFNFNSALTSINVSGNNPNFSSKDGVLFDKSQKSLTFYPDGKGTSYQIPTGVTVIDTAAFEGSTLIQNVIIPSSVVKLSKEAFYWCTNLNSITIPASITSIENYAFYNCISLQSIYANAVTPINLMATDSTFAFVNKALCTLYVPTGSKSQYQTAEVWRDFSKIIEHTVTVADILPAADIKVFIQKQQAVVDGVSFGELVSVYSIHGQNVYNKKANSELVRINLPAKGVYMVRVGRQSYKLVNY